MPTVSVVIPVYNGEAHIGEALHSVFGQTYHDYEVIVVNDGSTDHTEETLRPYRSRIRYVCQDNGDVSKARNTGILHATGQYIAFLDQDDLWLPTKLEKHVAAFARTDQPGVVFSHVDKVSSSAIEEALSRGRPGLGRSSRRRKASALRAVNGDFLDELLQRCMLLPSAVTVRRSLFVEVGLFDERLRVCGDWDMWLRIALAGHTFSFVDEVLALYRVHSKNTSKDAEKMRADRLRVLDKFFEQSDLPQGYARLRSRAYARAYVASAHPYYNAREYTKFREDVRQALRSDATVLDWKIVRRFSRSYLMEMLHL
jgi:glycosyltransferase involved in cell wall biosynthesis